MSRSLKRLRVPLDALLAGRRELPDSASHYVSRVHRLEKGDALLLFDGAARVEADATIVHVNAGRVLVEVETPRAVTTPFRREITLVQCLAKGDKMDAIVRDATEVGVTRIAPVSSVRSVVKLGDRSATKLQRWRKIAEEASRQCGRSDVPDVLEPMTFDDAVKSIHADVALLLTPHATLSAGAILRGARDQSVAIVVGSEGGFDDAELAHAEASGWKVATLGKLVLRTETVAAAILGALLVLEDDA